MVQNLTGHVAANASSIQPMLGVSLGNAETWTAVGTLALALATYKFAADASRQAKRDRITKEMDLLISPLKIAYHEIDSKGIDGKWWEYCFIPMIGIRTDPAPIQRFRDAIRSIDQYRYLAPENLRRLIDEFLLRLHDMERGKDSGNLGDFQQPLMTAAKNLYYSGNVEGGLVEWRYYELTKELETLNKDLITKIRDLSANIKSSLHQRRKPPTVIQTQLVG